MLEIMLGLSGSVLGVKAVGEVDDDNDEVVIGTASGDYLSGWARRGHRRA